MTNFLSFISYTFICKSVFVDTYLFLFFGVFFGFGFFLGEDRRYMAEILPIQCKTLSNQSIFVKTKLTTMKRPKE